MNPSWNNPSQEWHVGAKLIYELFTSTLSARLKVYLPTCVYIFHIILLYFCLLVGLPHITQKERKKKWDEKNQEAISEALWQLNEFEKVFITIASKLNYLYLLFPIYI